MGIQIKRLLGIFAMMALVYFGTYLIFRYRNAQFSELDKKVYVIFPEDKILYYVYRPMTIADDLITGMQFHIGPHR